MRGDRSILIAIEGIDGAGKTTQAAMLREALESSGLDVIASREPTFGIHGNRIRELAAKGRLSLAEELEAFVDDRKEHVETVIGPALDAGKAVILDRYYYSTIAYQGARGADVAEIRRRMEVFAPVPDAVFLIDVKPFLGLYRISESRGDTPNAFENVENLTAVREVFLSLGDPNIIKIDGEAPPAQVHRAILDSFVAGPLKAKRCAMPGGCYELDRCDPRFEQGCEWRRVSEALADRPAAIQKAR